MAKLPMCRICLAENVKMHVITNTLYQEIYQRLTMMPFETKDSRPIQACYVCCARLRNSYELRKNCLQSEELFTQMLQSSAPKLDELLESLTSKRLSVKQLVIQIDISPEVWASLDSENDMECATETVEVKIEPENAEDVVDVDEYMAERRSITIELPNEGDPLCTTKDPMMMKHNKGDVAELRALPTIHKSKPLSKEETRRLLSLLEGSFNSKNTNASNINRIKVEDWQRITDAFNATIGICRRTPQELRQKWRNLKDNSRKRSTLMLVERIKAGPPQRYFPPDDILDRVAALLDTGKSLMAMFGDDAESSIGDGGASSSSTIDILPPNYNIVPLMNNSLLVTFNCPSTSMGYEASPATPTDNYGTGDGLVKYVQTYTHTSNIPKEMNFKSSGVKQKLLKPDEGYSKNMALDEYFKTKKEYIDAKKREYKKIRK